LNNEKVEAINDIAKQTVNAEDCMKKKNNLKNIMRSIIICMI
jgi:hypothetical protein